MSKTKLRKRAQAKALAKETYSELPEQPNKFTLTDYQRMHTLAFALWSNQRRFEELLNRLHRLASYAYEENGSNEPNSEPFEHVLEIISLVHRIVLTLNKKEPKKKVYQYFHRTFFKVLNRPLVLSKLYLLTYVSFEAIE